MLLKQVVGQAKAKQQLIQMWEDNRLPHALLLVGAEGQGGLPLAHAFIQFIFCKNKSATDACGVCDACTRIAKLEHPDVHFSFPSIVPKPNTKVMSKHFIKQFREYLLHQPYGTTYDWLQFINAENKQGNLSADECREIIDVLNLKSYEGAMKVQVIWRPEYLGKEGNILLKLIEEPPADTYLILVAEELDSILPTILSRTQLVKLTPIAVGEIASALTAQNLADSNRSMQIAQMSGGSYTEALALLAHTENDLFPEVKHFFNIVFTNNRREISKFVDTWAKAGREEQKYFLHYIIQLIGQAIRMSYVPTEPLKLPPADAEFVSKLAAKRLSVESLHSMVKLLSDTSYHIERNAHGKTQLHALCIKMVYLVNGTRVPQLI